MASLDCANLKLEVEDHKWKLELTVSDLVATTLGRVTSMSPIHLVVVDFRAMSTWRYHVYYVAMRDNTISAFVFR